MSNFTNFFFSKLNEEKEKKIDKDTEKVEKPKDLDNDKKSEKDKNFVKKDNEPKEIEQPEVKQLSIEEIKIQQTINQTQRLIQYVEFGTIYRKWNELNDVEKLYLTNLYGNKTMLSKRPAFYLFCNADDGTKNKILEIYGNSIIKEGEQNAGNI